MVILNIGSGSRIVSGCINIDIMPFPKVGIVANNAKLPLVSGSADKIICTSVLEHSSDFEMAIAEMHRTLKPTGRILVTVPFLDPYHVYPGQTADYYRYTQSGIMHSFGKYFTVDSLVVECGPMCAAAHAAAVAVAVLCSFNAAKLYVAIYALMTAVLLPVRLLDHVVCRSRFAHCGAAYFLFEATRKECVTPSFSDYAIPDPFRSSTKNVAKNNRF